MMEVPRHYLLYLSLHKDCTSRIMNRAGKYSHLDLETTTDPQAIRIKRMAFAVMNEIHYMRAFVRLSPLGEKVLYGYMKPQHKIGQDVASILAKRNPGMIVLLGNNSESWTCIFDGQRYHSSSGGSMEQVKRELKDYLDATEGMDSEEIWETYYWSQYADERRNITYYKSNMPRRYRENANLKVESNTGRTTLDHFDPHSDH